MAYKTNNMSQLSNLYFQPQKYEKSHATANVPQIYWRTFFHAYVTEREGTVAGLLSRYTTFDISQTTARQALQCCASASATSSRSDLWSACVCRMEITGVA